MLKSLLRNKLRVLLFILLVGLLALVRIFENELFYDPFLDFFKREYTTLPLPDFEGLHLFGSLFFRYFLNTVISLAMIYVAFKDKEMLAFAAMLYGVFFVILIVLFFGIMALYENQNNLVLFYVRRFLIQPLFVILFLPAFYYQNRISKK